MKIKKGDTVLIASGKDRGRKGKVMRVLSQDDRIVVEGLNLRKKHVKARRQGQKGQVVEIAAPLPVSNAKLVCPKCGKAVRIGYQFEGGEKKRVCRQCKATL